MGLVHLNIYKKKKKIVILMAPKCAKYPFENHGFYNYDFVVVLLQVEIVVQKKFRHLVH